MPEDVVNATTAMISECMQDPDFQAYIKTTLDEFMAPLRNSSSQASQRRRTLDILGSGTDARFPGAEAIVGFMARTGSDMYVAMKQVVADEGTTIKAAKTPCAPGTPGCLPTASLSSPAQQQRVNKTLGFLDRIEEAGVPLRAKMCRRHLGSDFYGNMAVFCREAVLSKCDGGKATMETSGCGPKPERWKAVMEADGPITYNCQDFEGISPKGSPEDPYTPYRSICFHQSAVGYTDFTWDDGPSAPWYAVYLGRYILTLANTAFLKLSLPNIRIGDVKELAYLLWDAQGYLEKQGEIEVVEASASLMSNPNAYTNYNYLFWEAGVRHDNCYHHEPAISG